MVKMMMVLISFAASSYLKLVKPLLTLEVPHLSKPNDCQQSAVKHAMQHPFSLIQGPPGTGKTVTAIRLAYHFVKLNKTLPQEPDTIKPQVMICGPSNKSVDVIAGQYFQHFYTVPYLGQSRASCAHGSLAGVPRWTYRHTDARVRNYNCTFLNLDQLQLHL